MFEIEDRGFSTLMSTFSISTVKNISDTLFGVMMLACYLCPEHAKPRIFWLQIPEARCSYRMEVFLLPRVESKADLFRRPYIGSGSVAFAVSKFLKSWNPWDNDLGISVTLQLLLSYKAFSNETMS
jgi:hypothetical protein